jgi:hypothetical protein
MNSPVSRFQPARRDNVDGMTEELKQFVAQVEQVEEIARRLELDQEVEIARRCLLTPGDGTEEGDRPSLVTTSGSFDVTAAVLHEPSQRGVGDAWHATRG